MLNGFVSANSWNEIINTKFDGVRPSLLVDDEEIDMTIREEIDIDMNIEESTVDDL